MTRSPREAEAFELLREMFDLANYRDGGTAVMSRADERFERYPDYADFFTRAAAILGVKLGRDTAEDVLRDFVHYAKHNDSMIFSPEWATGASLIRRAKKILGDG